MPGGFFLSVNPKIGFRPPLLGPLPVRISVLGQRDGLTFLAKPPGIAASRSPREPGLETIESALRCQIEDRKPELERLGFSSGRVLIPLPTECSGLLPVVHDADAVEFWTNAYGSLQFTLRFSLLTLTSDLPDEVSCDLPIAAHFKTGLALISHRTGKKTQTIFTRNERFPRFESWQATTRFLRLDQIRLHAHEIGLSVLGEDTYLPPEAMAIPSPSLSDLQRRLRKPTPSAREPLHPHPHIHLGSLTLPDGTEITAPLPGSLQQVHDRIRSAKPSPRRG